MADLKISELSAIGGLETIDVDNDLIPIAKNQGAEGNRKYTLREVWDSFKNDDTNPFPQYLTSTDGDSLYQPIGGTVQNVITYTTSRNSISADLGSWLRYDTNSGVTYYLDQEQVPGWPLMEEITIEQVGDGDITIDMASSYSGQIIYDINKWPTTNGPGSVIKIRKVVDSAGASSDRFLIYGDLLPTLTTGPATPIIQCIPMACSDETTNLTTGLKITFRMPYAMTLTDVRASFTVFNLYNPSVVDIHCNGVSIFTLGNLLTIDPEEYSSVTGTPYVFNDNYLPDDSEIEVYLTDIGAGTPKGLKVYLIGEVG